MIVVVSLILLSALLHAGWNAIIRSEGDRFGSLTLLCAAEVVVAAPCIAMLPSVSTGCVPFLLVSVVLHVAYCYCLARAYDVGGLAEVYPIARGTSPILVTLAAWAFVGERLGAAESLGIALVCGGIAGLVVARTAVDRGSLSIALLTGGLIAAYTLVDGLGARASGSPFEYVAWLCVGEGIAMVVLHRILRGELRIDLRRRAGWTPIGGAVLAMGAYGIVVFALVEGPMGPVSALRETSVLFAALIARAVLGEPMGFARASCCGAISLGAVALAL